MKILNDDILYDIDNSINNELAKHRIQQEREKLDYEKQYYIKEIERLKSQLQQKENIIKEVREFIKSNEFIGRIRLSSENKEAINKLLEILDKGNK